jgi:hypothetical protein
MSSGTEHLGTAHPGRHRRGGADGWTPPVPARSSSHRHRGDDRPLDPPVSGSLPLPQPRERQLAFPAAHGSLPLAEDPAEITADLHEPIEPEAPPQRTRVSLAAPNSRRPEPEDDDVRVYVAPPEDGLGGFDLGSVPASVTPPKTWRKAAWFATGASGAVVVGLLFAGTFLVGKPVADEAVQGAWPGYQGGAPAISDDQAVPPGQRGGAGGGPHTPKRPDRAVGETAPGTGAATRDDATEQSPSGPASGPAATGAPAQSGPPQKPPVTPAGRETPVTAPWWYSFPPDAQTMGDNSEKFFNTVTTDPNQASSVTTGQLHDQGAQALAERYAGIAYFEVKKISIDQQRGVTVNTVEVTHTDGTKTMETRTLTFGDGDKISGDGQ